VAHDFDVDIVAKITQDPKIKVLEGLSMNQVYMGVSNWADQSKELADKRVRQAVSYAIDYDGIIKGIVRGAGEQPSSMIPLGLLGGDKTLARKRDVAKAKQLLTEAGYPNGVSLKLSYWTAPLLGVSPEPLAAKLQADLAQAGINVTLDPGERSVVLAAYRAGKVQLMLASWSPDYLDPDPFADAFYGAGPVPKRVHYSNPKVTDLIATAKKEQDPKKREALYMEINKIALEDVPEIMLIQPKNFVGLNPSIKGYEIHPIWWVTVANLSR